MAKTLLVNRHPHRLAAGSLAAVLLALGGAPLAAQGAVELIPVAEAVWAARRAYVGSNAAVIVGAESVVVVDSHTTPAAARDTLAAIRRITDAPVRFVIDTHWHTDHSVGASAYREAFPGLQVISHATVREDLPRFGPQQMEVSTTFVERALEQAEERLAGDLDPWGEPWSTERHQTLQRFVADQRHELPSLLALDFELPTLTFEHALTLHRSEGPIEVLHLGRGHTRGDIVAYLPQQQVLIAGDLVTAPGLYVGNHSRPSEWLGVLAALQDLDFHHIIPGHGEVLHGKDHLRLARWVLSWVVEGVRESLDEGLRYTEIAALFTLERMLTDLSDGQPETTRALERMSFMVEDAVAGTYRELTGRLDE